MSAPPRPAAQKLVPAQSEIAFASKQMGVSVDGHFKKFDAQIAFDPAKPEASKIAFAIDIGSATLGAPESDAELPKPDWFNAAKFPQATFQSGAVRKSAPGKYEVAGKLSIKGNVRDVVVPVTLSANRRHHHRQRRVCHQAPGLQDWRERVGRHLDGGRRRAGQIQARADRRGQTTDFFL